MRRLLLLHLLFLIVLSGCGRSIQRKTYLLNIDREGVGARQGVDNNLLVRDVRVSPPFDSQMLTYRKSGNEYEQDYYNRFLVSPGEMIGEHIEDWFSGSELFGNVVGAGSELDAEIHLAAKVQSLYADFSGEGSPVAKLVMQVTVYDVTKDDEIILKETYREDVLIADNRAEEIVRAYEEGLRRVLVGLEKDIAGKF